MYLALRDLRFARGRFSLIVLAVALMTLLVGFLTGLTSGLAGQNISSLVGLGPDRVVFAMPEDDDSASFSASSVDEDQVAAWRADPGVEAAAPLGIVSTPLSSATADANVALFASERTDDAAAFGADAFVPVASDGITLGSDTAEELGVEAGDTVELAGRDLVVGEIVDPQAYSHQAVAWVQLGAYHDLLADTHRPAGFATVLLIDGNPDAEAIDAAAGTTSESFLSSLLALESFKSEIGSLGLMIGMLVVIAVIVIGVFFLVWSMQRQRDVAVLKALGAGDAWLRRDALGQALVVLVIGVGIGIALTIGLGALVAGAVPFTLSTLTMGLPALGMVLAGLVGALVSLRQITKADPLSALNAAA